MYSILEEEFRGHARIQKNPPGQDEDLEQGWICSSWLGSMLDPNPIVWRGNGDIPTTKQGLKILGCPLGHHDFVQDQFSKLSDGHYVLLRRIEMVENLQSAWFLLVCGAAARANFFLRSVSPGQISTFVSHHDDQMWACLSTLLRIDPASVTHSSRIGATLPLRLGGLGFSSAVSLRHAAHGASWADCIRMKHQRHPIVARTIIEAVEANDPAQAAQGVVSSAIPSWDGKDPDHGPVEEEDASQPRFGRQKDAAAAVHKVFLEEEVRSLLDEPEEALLRSQGAPLASVPFTSLPTLRETTFALQPFRLLLLRRLRLALPLSATLVPVWPSTRLPWSPQGLRVRGRESRATVVPRGSPQWHGFATRVAPEFAPTS